MTCVESLENILHQIGLQGRTVLLWSVVPTTMADCVKYRPNFERNHVKLIYIINSLRGFSKGTVLCGGHQLGIADLHCQKVESTKWLKHKLRATIGGQGRTVLLWSVVPTTMADFVKYRPNFPIHISNTFPIHIPGEHFAPDWTPGANCATVVCGSNHYG